MPTDLLFDIILLLLEFLIIFYNGEFLMSFERLVNIWIFLYGFLTLLFLYIELRSRVAFGILWSGLMKDLYDERIPGDPHLDLFFYVWLTEF